MLDLEFTPEQDMLRETVRKVCATHSPLSVVRELEDDPVGYSPELWKQMAELDLIGLLLPEDHGGSAMSALEGVVLYEELGRALAPTPHFASAVLCGSSAKTRRRQRCVQQRLWRITSSSLSSSRSERCLPKRTLPAFGSIDRLANSSDHKKMISIGKRPVYPRCPDFGQT